MGVDIVPHFLDLSTSWRCEVSCMPQLLYSQYPINRRLGESLERKSAPDRAKVVIPARPQGK
jgi:hypothetical protein